MGALAAVRPTRETRLKNVAFPLAIGAKAFQGGIACGDVATGTMKQAQAGNANLIKLGEFADTLDNTNGSATVPLLVSLDDEITAHCYDNDIGTPVTTANLFQVCYFLDDHTVTMNPAGASVAGRVLDVDTSSGVTVAALDPFGPRSLPVVAASVLGAFVANALAPTNLQQDAVYDVPATSGASTITLPTAALDGTRVAFCADGTKNANTVQYVDQAGTANLTTALTALKRHRVEAVKENGKWFASAYVGP